MLRFGHRITTGVLLVAGLWLAADAALAASVERYVVDHAGIRMEISAPRADIIRVRAGQTSLPEDASWAVATDLRAKVTPLEVSEAGSMVELRTAALVVRVDPQTLAVTITDKNGHTVLADAKGTALIFENGGFRLRKQMPDDAHYFGLGDKTGPLDRREQAFTLWNTDQYGFGTGTDPLYKALPFVLGATEDGHAFGLFMDNTWRSFFDFGKSERTSLVFGAEGGPIDYYVMAGPDPKAVVAQYAYLTGKAPLVPQWALGFQQSKYSYMTDAEVRGVAGRLRADRLPSDVIYLDIDYQDRNRPFTVNKAAFPDLATLAADLRKQDLRLIVITDMHVASAPNQGYMPYDSGIKADIFVKNPDGTPFVGTVWPGPAVFPDFSRPKARDWWGEQYAAFVKDGISGFWNDMDEPAIFNVRSKTMPLDTVHRIEEPGFAPRNASQAEMHNVYGLLNSRATYDGLRKLRPDERPFVLTRASYAGGQRYAATWTGDNTSSWAHLRLSTSQLVNLGLSGFAYSGDDIGGFTGEPPSPDLLTRWIEIGAFNPIFRDHFGKGKAAQEPWVHGEEHLNIRRRYIEERYRLMPYLYGLAEDNSRTGMPIMRPVFLNFPEVLKDGVGATQDEFMLGDDLLIAPAPLGESPAPYGVRLPGKGWYDYWTGAQLTEAGSMETPRIDRLPVFVRPGAIFAKQPLVQSTEETPKGPLELHVYPGADCHGDIYFDDGVSYGYQRGDYLRQAVHCSSDGKGLAISFDMRQGTYKPWWTGYSVIIHGATADRAAKLDRKTVKGRYDATAHTLTFDLPDLSRAAVLTLNP